MSETLREKRENKADLQSRRIQIKVILCNNHSQWKAIFVRFCNNNVNMIFKQNHTGVLLFGLNGGTGRLIFLT